jgi:adenylylsulfate kinase
MTDPLLAPGFVLWFTGLPASGKTTLAYALQRKLANANIPTFILDSDEMRAILTPQPRYSPSERDWFYGVLGQFAGLLAKSGVNVLIAATANRRHYRDQARQQITRFAEVYVHCDLETCQQRDPKGIYAQAQEGTAVRVPGIGSSYEPPHQPEVVVDTTLLTVDEGATAVYQQLAAFF